MKTIRVALSNRFASFDCDPDTLQTISDYFSFYPPGYRWAPSFKLWLSQVQRNKLHGLPANTPVAGWNGKIKMLKKGKLSAGLFRALRSEAEEELDIKFLVTYTIPKRAASQTILPPVPSEDEKYSYQADCVLAMQKALRRGGGIVLNSTGSGKTKISGDFFKSIPDTVCLFIVDTVDLLDQSRKELAQWTGEKVGKVGEMEFELGRITVGTIQTLDRHREKAIFKRWFKTIGVVAVDELHDLMGKWNIRLLNRIKPMAVYGLTATLRLSKKEVRFRAYSFAGPVIYEFPLSEGVKRKVLKKGKVMQFLFPALRLLPFKPGDAYRQQVVENSIKHEACFDIVQELIAQGYVIIVLVERIAHLKTLDELFSEIPHEIAYGPVSKKDRQEAVHKIENNEVPLIIANKVFRKGINMKRVDAAIDLAELRDMNAAKQKYGRLVRLHPDKKELLYIDIGTQRRMNTDYGQRAALAAIRRRKAFIELELPIQKFKVSDGTEAVKILQNDPRRQKKTIA